jgi:hypothetical protein
LGGDERQTLQVDTTRKALLVHGQAETHMNIGMTGHQDIPLLALEYVRRGINRVFDDVKDDLVGVSSLAAGADQVFASLVLERGGRLQVILPCKGYEKTFSRSEDLKNFHALLERATSVETLSFEEPSEEAYLAAGCRVVDLSEMLLAVWDGQPAKGKGGTADIVEYARSRGLQLEIVWPAGTVR